MANFDSLKINAYIIPTTVQSVHVYLRKTFVHSPIGAEGQKIKSAN